MSDSDYTDDELPSTSRGRHNRTQKTQKTQLDPEKINELAIKMYIYILNFSTNKIPIKKSEMIKNVLDKQDRLFIPVMEKTRHDLKQIIGYDCIEVPDKKPKQFIVISVIPNYTLSMEPAGNNEMPQAIVLFIVLSFIFMKGGKVKEIILWQYILKQLGIEDEEDSNHYFFGDVKKLINEVFIKQLYLSRDKVILEGMQEEVFVISWGERATIEYSKSDILKAVCSKDIMNKPERYYIQQYLEANEGDQGQELQEGQHGEAMETNE